jgi:L-fuconolactonase
MILDGHCHIWENWPYQPPVPDIASRARAEQLLYEMDANGVDCAVVICARIGDNAGNVDYAFDAARRHGDRLIVFPDLESKWSPDYRKPGARDRLAAALDRWQFSGFTMYLTEEEDGSWLTSDEGRDFFALATERKLIASLSIMPHQTPAIIALAIAFPTLPILLHHFAFVGPRSAATPNGLDLVAAAARWPNIFIKYSGMGNVAAPEQDYPYPDLAYIPGRLGAAFGAKRMIWGSDYPVSRKHMTYRQAIRLLERHGPFSPDELPPVFGGNLQRLLDNATG